ncbi:cytochrome c oxidase accessory protein CcoG [Thalassotalea insulae]|uniref:Cytochrome c oxidase accessory protein CcoG n=1 Tax=Thalassotalea insulae TaxID=2056778 RepID=A0ABQ6GSZ5_9GAMM|nr:cytochrome c oxidase accessory protein CcoG [Thalassotalea insulae]GLX79073.1 cytochrome c oxidase accessory protein CcoG [Thalassotalea insulae]
MHQLTNHNEQVIFQTKHIDGKHHIREQHGRYQRMRRYLAWSLVLLFIALPLVQFQGQQALLFDIAQQKFNVFAWSFYPQDLMLFVFIFLFSAFALFYVATRYGRVWCGYTCPQTIWTMMYLWVEHRIEGNRQAKIKLNNSKLTLKKLLIKTVKHAIWFTIALVTATIFISYFIPAHQLYSDLLQLDISLLTFNWIAFFACCTYINAGFIREKMCEHMCPYSRFQSVMMTKSTKVISYDHHRGEGRGARKMNQAIPQGLGDCVDCKLCVQVCPVGIDIREGLQYQCISCGLCIDACDQTMDKFSYQRGLIKYASEHKQRITSWRNISYLLVLATILAAGSYWLMQRNTFEVAVFKDRNILYRELAGELIENSYQIKIFNKSQSLAYYQLNVNGISDVKLKSPDKIVVQPGQQKILTVNVVAKSVTSNLVKDNNTEIRFIVKNLSENQLVKVKSTFYAPS